MTTPQLNAGQLTSPDELKQRLNQTHSDEERSLEQWLDINRSHEEAVQSEQRRLQRRLRRFLRATLVILALAIGSLPFVDALCAWPWTARLLIILAGVGLGIGPALVIREAL